MFSALSSKYLNSIANDYSHLLSIHLNERILITNMSESKSGDEFNPVILHITQSRNIGNNVMQALNLDDSLKDFLNHGLCGPIESCDGSVHWFLSTSGIPLALDLDPAVDTATLLPSEILNVEAIKVKLVTSIGKESFQNRLESILDLDELNDVVLWFDTSRYGNYVAEMVSQCICELYDGIDVYRVLYPEDMQDDEGNVIEAYDDVRDLFKNIVILYQGKFLVDSEANLEYKRMAESIIVEKELTLRKNWALTLYIEKICKEDNNGPLCQVNETFKSPLSPYILSITNLIYQRSSVVDEEDVDFTRSNKLHHYTQSTLLQAMRLNRISLPKNRKKDLENGIANGFIARITDTKGGEELVVPTKFGKDICEWLESCGLMEAVWKTLVNEISDTVSEGQMSRPEAVRVALLSVRQVLANADRKFDELHQMLAN